VGDGEANEKAEKYREGEEAVEQRPYGWPMLCLSCKKLNSRNSTRPLKSPCVLGLIPSMLIRWCAARCTSAWAWQVEKSAVIASGEKQAEAQQAGVGFHRRRGHGGKNHKENWTDFDALIATPT